MSEFWEPQCRTDWSTPAEPMQLIYTSRYFVKTTQHLMEFFYQCLTKISLLIIYQKQINSQHIELHIYQIPTNLLNKNLVDIYWPTNDI